jgi:hypothetical protein
MPQASTLSEPKTGVVPPVRTTKNEPADADDTQPKTGSSFERVDVSHFSPVDILDYPVSFYIQVIACRRSGKSFTVNWMLQQYQKSDKAFDAIFLFSPTDAGFEGIPKKFRYKTLDPIESIMNQQREIKKHNLKAKKAEDRIKSRVLLVIDDCASGDAMKSCKQLEELALNGRHLGNDGVDGNGLSVFVLSQSVTKCSRATRLNCDVWLTNSIASARERDLLMDECLFLSTERGAKRYARNLFESLATSKDFRFLSIELFRQNKKAHEDYIKLVDATEEKEYQLFGTPSDDESSDDEYEPSNLVPRTMSGGRTFCNSRPQYLPY